MYRVMIVDDDKLIREDIVCMVDCHKLGFYEPVQCSDGLSALNLLTEAFCELVITDISMPRLNGVELIRKAQLQPQKPLFVVLSNYDDFSYVKDAMRLGAMEYLLKYQLESVSLVKLLQSMRRQLDDRNQQEHRQQRLTDFQNRQYAEMVTYFWKDLYFERVDIAALLQRADALGIQHSGGMWVPVMITLQQDSVGENANQLHTLLAELPSRLPLDGVIYLVRVEQDKILVIAHLPETSFLLLNKCLADLTRTLEEQLSLLSLPCFLHCGKFCVHFLELPLALQKIKDSATLIFYFGYHKTVMNPVLKILPFDSLTADGLDALIASAGFVPIQNLHIATQRFFTHLREHPVAPEAIKQHIHTALCAANHDAAFTEGCSAADKLQTLDQYSQAVEQLLVTLHSRRELLPHSVRPEIKHAVDYIYLHYANSPSLQQLSEVSGLSRNYFSRIFKEETGVTYTDFLNLVRVEHAKRMLECNNLRTNEVASYVGFADYRYFCRFFKNAVGTTCTEYRKRFGQEANK